jgi:NAD(P)-dependent dehydrogenase (short-subunit alcohol dehydrogenase family)
MSTVFVLGITSDIGRELAARFAAQGWTVVGTHRAGGNLAGVPAAGRLLPCDLASRESVDALLAACRAQNLVWDLLVVAAGTEEPIGSFWECDPEEWDAGIAVNALAPLRIVRGLYPLRRTGDQPSVAFFSGAGTNGAAPAYSAYCAAKIFLIKMCELLDAESPDTSFFIIGPGIVRTKIHDQTLRAPHRSGPNYRKVTDFLGSAAPGTSHDDIFACLQWCLAAGKATVGGRNISLVQDAWRQGGERLARQLRHDPDQYKLRRHGNDLKLPDQPS